VELGYVETMTGKDKREKLVHLSKHGEKLVLEIKLHLNPFFEQALAGVPKQDIDIATQVLARICMNINQ